MQLDWLKYISISHLTQVREELVRKYEDIQSAPLQAGWLRKWTYLHHVCGVAERCQGPLCRACCCCSVTQSCLTLWVPMDYSTPGLPVLHHLLDLAQTHVHWVSDAIQASHPLSSPSPPAFNLSQHQSFLMSQLFTSGGPSTEFPLPPTRRMTCSGSGS